MQVSSLGLEFRSAFLDEGQGTFLGVLACDWSESQ